MRCQEREFDCILCVPPTQGCKKGTGGYNQISFIAKTTVNFRKRTLFPKPAVMIIPSLYSQVRSKQLQLKWHTGNSRLSLLVAPVQADNRAWLCSLPQVLNSLFCIQITQGCFSTEPLILWLEQALLLCCWHVTSGTACVLKQWGFSYALEDGWELHTPPGIQQNSSNADIFAGTNPGTVQKILPF